MNTTKVSDSTLHRALADIASFLESNVPEKYTFMDGGETLQIKSDALAQCRRSHVFNALEAAYEQAGCYVVEEV